jgi:hypothetical protein
MNATTITITVMALVLTLVVGVMVWPVVWSTKSAVDNGSELAVKAAKLRFPTSDIIVLQAACKDREFAKSNLEWLNGQMSAIINDPAKLQEVLGWLAKNPAPTVAAAATTTDLVNQITVAVLEKIKKATDPAAPAPAPAPAPTK